MDINLKDTRIGVVGCGKMASAILGGAFKNNFLVNENVFVYDKDLEASARLCSKYNFNEAYSIKDLVSNVDIIFIAVKPYNYREVLLEIKENYNNQLILSILAGVKIKKYEAILPDAPIVRIMPNTPALVNEGISALCFNENVDEIDKEFALKFMQNCGNVIATTEDKIDVITALSGSGPAFYFELIHLLAKSAQKLGLDYKDAIMLSAQTALGSAKMLIENEFKVDELIKNVTTPGGCTEVGNNVLLNSDIDIVFDKLIQDTTNKAIELG